MNVKGGSWTSKVEDGGFIGQLPGLSSAMKGEKEDQICMRFGFFSLPDHTPYPPTEPTRANVARRSNRKCVGDSCTEATEACERAWKRSLH